MRAPLILIVTVLLTGCGGYRSSSEKAVYRVALDAVKNDSHLPVNADLYPMKKTELYVGKSAARVDLPYDFVNASGQTVTASYTVWLQYMHHAWQVDRLLASPEH